MVRVKRRYFVLNVKFQEKKHSVRNRRSLGNEILKKIEQLYGEFGLAAFKNAFQFKYTNLETGTFYVRTDRSASELLTTALPLITAVDRMPATISCLFKAATLRHAHIFLKNYHEKAIRKETNTKEVKLSKKQKILKKRKERV